MVVLNFKNLNISWLKSPIAVMKTDALGKIKEMVDIQAVLTI